MLNKQAQSGQTNPAEPPPTLNSLLSSAEDRLASSLGSIRSVRDKLFGTAPRELPPNADASHTCHQDYVERIHKLLTELDNELSIIHVKL